METEVFTDVEPEDVQRTRDLYRDVPGAQVLVEQQPNGKYRITVTYPAQDA